MMILSERLKWLRDKHKYSQKELAEILGVTVSSYQKYEYGSREPSIEALLILSKIYDEDIGFLIGQTNSDRKARLLEERLNVLEQRVKVHKKYTESLNVLKEYLEPEIRHKIFMNIRRRGIMDKREYDIKLFEYLTYIHELPLHNLLNNKIAYEKLPLSFEIIKRPMGALVEATCKDGYEMIVYTASFRETPKSKETNPEAALKKVTKFVKKHEYLTVDIFNIADELDLMDKELIFDFSIEEDED